MIKIKVQNNNISILGHANYDDYGKDIVCASVSSIVMCSVEAIANFDIDAINVEQTNEGLIIDINKKDTITITLIENMIKCLKELEMKYSKNIKIIDKEE